MSFQRARVSDITLKSINLTLCEVRQQICGHPQFPILHHPENSTCSHPTSSLSPPFLVVCHIPLERAVAAAASRLLPPRTEATLDTFGRTVRNQINFHMEEEREMGRGRGDIKKNHKMMTNAMEQHSFRGLCFLPFSFPSIHGLRLQRMKIGVI